jgi:hypothetical protein
MQVEHDGTQSSGYYSAVSWIERPTNIKAEYSYSVTLEGISEQDMEAFMGLLIAEKVEQYENGLWHEVDITKGTHLIKDESQYILNFEVTRKVESQDVKMYINEVLCDMDDGEVVAINKQVNNIAEMKDRQSDFTASFKIQKTRAMRELFELSDQNNSTFPYMNQVCKLIQRGLELVKSGILNLIKCDKNYYHVSVLSGNASLFSVLDTLKLSDLELTTAQHVWAADQAYAAQQLNRDYLYPLLEPSNDGSMAAITDDGTTVKYYIGWIYPFIKFKIIWDEIFSNAGYTVEGDILTNDIFKVLWMPISNLEITDIARYKYSLFNDSIYNWAVTTQFPGGTVMNGTAIWGTTGTYVSSLSATYKFKVIVKTFYPITAVYLRKNGIAAGSFVKTYESLGYSHWEIEEAGIGNDLFTFLGTKGLYYYFYIAVIEITDARLAVGAGVYTALHLPDMKQSDVVKMICNMFGLIPEVNARDRKVKFWNYLELYKNVATAKDWSEYLSEEEYETEFKFGNYAQNNYLKYKESDDVLKDNGKGNMQVDDETLEGEKDQFELPVSTCDEVTILTDVNVSRINMNDYDSGTDTYIQNSKIDPRIVVIRDIAALKSIIITTHVTGKTPSGVEYESFSPKTAMSADISMTSLITEYVGLSRLLTKSKIKKLKFNLPEYIVAYIDHSIPVYLSQYNAYFYVNKISNYVCGKLTTVELIKL